jgi:hypothetical protein
MAHINPATIEVRIGGIYPFYAEVQEEYKPAEERLRRFTGTLVEVLAERHEGDEGSLTFLVRAHDGTEFDAHPEEINGWDYALNQFFWNDGRYGKSHSTDFLGNEHTDDDARKR